MIEESVIDLSKAELIQKIRKLEAENRSLTRLVKPYLCVKDLVRLTSLSERKIRELLPLMHKLRVGRKILVRRPDFERFMDRFAENRQQEHPLVGQMVEDFFGN